MKEQLPLKQPPSLANGLTAGLAMTRYGIGARDQASNRRLGGDTSPRKTGAQERGDLCVSGRGVSPDSQVHAQITYCMAAHEETGAATQGRTVDLSITNGVLYH
jgi:hypothetical protein